MMDVINSYNVLANIDKGSEKFISLYGNAKVERGVKTAESKKDDKDLGERDIKYIVIKGLKDEAKKATEEALENMEELEFINRALSGENITLRDSGVARRDNIYIDDAVSGILLLGLNGTNCEVYNVSSNGEMGNFAAVDEIASIIIDLVNEKYNIKKVRSIASYFFNIICKFNTKKIYFSKQIYYNKSQWIRKS